MARATLRLSSRMRGIRAFGSNWRLAATFLGILGCGVAAAAAEITVDWSKVAGLRTYTNAYSSTASAWTGTTPACETSPYQGIVEMGIGVATTNDVNSYFADGNKDGKFLSYCGYVWNDSATNENWTFACCMNWYSKLFIDGELKIDQVRYTGKTATVAMTPGVHAFEFRYCAPHGSSGAILSGAITNFDDEVFSNGSGESGGQWISKFGFAIDRQGRGTHNYKDYQAPFDSGDGSFFCFSTNLSEIGRIDNRPAFTKMTFAPGTTLDLNAEPFVMSVDNLKGLPSVINGNLTVTNLWTVPAADVAAGAVLEATGSFALADGATLSVTDISDLPKATVVIARAAGGLTLPPGMDGMPLTARGRYVLVQTSATELSLQYSPRGMAIIFR